jgi:hypothetical protein
MDETTRQPGLEDTYTFSGVQAEIRLGVPPRVAAWHILIGWCLDRRSTVVGDETACRMALR